MAITLNDNIKVNAGKPVEAKYLNNLVPYTSIAQVNATIPISERFVGLTVNINSVEYWYENGVDDIDLVVKTGGGTATGERIEKEYIQASHGFVIGDVIGWDNGLTQFRKVVSNTSETIEPIGLISEVPNPSGFTVVFAGYVNNISSILDVNSNPITGGTVYFLSSTVSGKLTPTQPTTIGDISKPIISTNTDNDGIVFQYRGGIISESFTGGTGGTVTAASGERIEKNINQTAHGFSIGEVVAFSGGTYISAIADGSQDGEIFGFISEVPDANNFTVVFAGYVTGITAVGLAPNTTYFVSSTVSGALSTSKPTTEGHIIKPLIATTNVDEGLVFQYLGVTVSTGITTNLITGGTNVGNGEQVFKTVSGDSLVFRTISGSGNTLVSTIGDDIIIDVTGFTNQVRIASGGTFNVENKDRFISVSGSTTINLPASPTIGQEVAITDIQGNASISTITIQGNGNNIIDDTFALINTDYGSLTLLWNGFIWSVIGFTS